MAPLSTRPAFDSEIEAILQHSRKVAQENDWLRDQLRVSRQRGETLAEHVEALKQLESFQKLLPKPSPARTLLQDGRWYVIEVNGETRAVCRNEHIADAVFKMFEGKAATVTMTPLIQRSELD